MCGKNLWSSTNLEFVQENAQKFHSDKVDQEIARKLP